MNHCKPCKWVPAACIEYFEKIIKERNDHLERVSRSDDAAVLAGKYGETPLQIAAKLCFDDHEVLWADAVTRVVTHEDMRNAFLSLERYGVDVGLLMLFACRAFMGPIGLERKTPSLREKWVGEVISMSKNLAELIQHSPLDDILRRKHRSTEAKFVVFNAAISALSGEKPKDTQHSNKCFNQLPPLLSELLLEVADGAQNIVNEQITMERPGDPKAKRAYFVRELTGFLRKQTDCPLRAVVAAFTSAVFDESIDVRQVNRLAP